MELTFLYDRPSDEEVTMTRMLDKVLRRSDAIDKESLCVLAGQRVCHHLQKYDTCIDFVIIGVASTLDNPLSG